jgi:hypothetical protein
MTYEFSYERGSRPEWRKVVPLSGGDTFKMSLVFENKEERENLSLEEIYSHMSNLVAYVKDVVADLDYIKVSDSIPEDGWHFGGSGWAEIDWVKEETLKWWAYYYYADKFSEEAEDV